MADSLQDIKASLVAEKEAMPELSTLTSDSSTAIWNLWLDIISFVTLDIQKLFDAFKQEVLDLLALLMPHTARWYVYKTKQFLYGVNLLPDSDKFDTAGMTSAQIAAAKIITNAALVELERGVRLKVATTINNQLAPINNDQLISLRNYIKKIKDAGVRVTVTTGEPDNIKVNLVVKFNPLVLKSDGSRLDGTAQAPVKDAINNYLKNIGFNGVFSIQKMVDAIQDVSGVEDLLQQNVLVRYGALPFTPVFINSIPDSGSYKMEDVDFTVTYEPA
ncbi:hypothetical protein ACFOWM_06320 [Ferruginibacter yonginensis]|uniref:Baseplate protein J-like domain-containing protein n=1 Tax=Ferruginibacter yonginensis TaxID=1310416 RepID=A0ABV8QQC4_9BACT